MVYGRVTRPEPSDAAAQRQKSNTEHLLTIIANSSNALALRTTFSTSLGAIDFGERGSWRRWLGWSQSEGW
jgi:hypothetical protein